MTEDKISRQSLNSSSDTTGNKTPIADYFHYNCQTPQVLNRDCHKGGNSKGSKTKNYPLQIGLEKYYKVWKNLLPEICFKMYKFNKWIPLTCSNNKKQSLQA